MRSEKVNEYAKECKILFLFRYELRSLLSVQVSKTVKFPDIGANWWPEYAFFERRERSNNNDNNNNNNTIAMLKRSLYGMCINMFQKDIRSRARE